jgi:hypothetical protein
MNRNKLLALGALCTLVVPGVALGWAAGTHAYIAKHTSKKGGLVTEGDMCRRVLGANGPDLFNSLFDDTPQQLALVLHTRDASANLAPWHSARTPDEQAFGYGFASHNDGWGTDSVSHFAGITYGKDDGYVVAKAAVLGDLLLPAIWPSFPFLPEDVARALSREVSHNFVEFAVDFLLAEADPGLGETLARSAACYDPVNDPDLLVDALGPWFAPVLSDDPATGRAMAEAWIRAVEPRFVGGLGANGYVLSLPYDQGLQLIAHQTALQAADLLAWKGLPAPPFDDLVALITAGIEGARALCRPDFMDEIEATIGRVNGRLSAEGISP